MVCPNCHSDQVIQVQDQHFCINCGQMVPEPAAPKVAESTIKIQDNGLPAGVKILPVNGESNPSSAAEVSDSSKAAADLETTEIPKPSLANESEPLIQPRVRLAGADDAGSEKKGKSKRGRPKAGKLDVPKMISASSSPLPPAPLPGPRPEQARLKKMSDITIPKPKVAAVTKQIPDKPHKHKAVHHALFAHKTVKKPPIHHVSVPPLHYGAVLGFSFRSRFQVQLVALMAVSAAVFAAVAGFGAWLLMTGRLQAVADRLTHISAVPIAELILLGCLYYVGKSVGQSAVVYGVAREADRRSVSLSRQLGVGINTFGRRLVLDLIFTALQLLVLGGLVALVIAGGTSWPVNSEVQVGVLFFVFLVLLYLESALAISRGLGSVILTLTGSGPVPALRSSWKLFSHRFELLAYKFLAFAMELILVAPFVILAAGLVLATPSALHIPVAIGVGALAWIAGALLGVGTAAWWASLYRKLVEVDRPSDSLLLASRQPSEASRSGLAVLVCLTTVLLTLCIALPWVRIP
jgi:hypothetical protein